MSNKRTGIVSFTPANTPLNQPPPLPLPPPPSLSPVSGGTNDPGRSSFFILDEGQHTLEYTQDSKMANAGTYVLNKEDHTLGNLLRMQLLRDPRVTFAGYLQPHPLIPRIDLKVQTSSSNSTPHTVLNHALEALSDETQFMKQQFEEALTEEKNQRAASYGEM